MRVEDMQFPIYRKYKNNKSYFKIINAESFEQLQIVGKTIHASEVLAKLYPEKLFIRDLLLNYEQMAEAITEKEYEEIKKRHPDSYRDSSD